MADVSYGERQGQVVYDGMIDHYSSHAAATARSVSGARVKAWPGWLSFSPPNRLLFWTNRFLKFNRYRSSLSKMSIPGIPCGYVVPI